MTKLTVKLLIPQMVAWRGKNTLIVFGRQRPEALGIESNSVHETFKDEICFDGQHYINSLPFKPHHKPIPDNFMLSKYRLHSLKNELDRDPDLKREHHEILQNYIKKGIIEKVDDEETQGKAYYLPHRAVMGSDKETTKVCIIFDGSAKVDQCTSLNEGLYSGPIFDIVFRFRLHKYILLPDVVFECWGDSGQRFLWFKDPFVDDLKVTVSIFESCVWIDLQPVSFECYN